MKRITIRSNKGGLRGLGRGPTLFVRLKQSQRTITSQQSKDGTRAGHCSPRKNKTQMIRKKKKKILVFSFQIIQKSKLQWVMCSCCSLPGPPRDLQPCQGPAPFSSQLSNLPFKNASFSGRSPSDPFSRDLVNPSCNPWTQQNICESCIKYELLLRCACSQSSKSPESAWKAAWKQTATQQRQLQNKPCYKSINAVLIS